MTTFPKQIGFLVEGGADQGALPVLTAKVLQCEIDPVFIRREENGFDGLVKNHKKFRGWVRSFQWRAQGGVIVVDNDRQQAGKRYNHIEAMLPSPLTVSVVIGVAVEMLEAWLIACPEAFEAVFNHSLHSFLKSNQLPESYPDPKRWVIIPYLHKYTAYQRLNREISQKIAQTEACQVEIIRQVCPSFEQFAGDLEAAFEEIS